MFSNPNFENPQFDNTDFFKPCTEINTTCSCTCLKASKTNPTLKATFEFIKNNPIFISTGEKVLVSIILKTSLLTNQSSGPIEEVVVRESTVRGLIEKVENTYVVITSNSGCVEKQIFTIPFNKIIEVIHPSIGAFFDKYVPTLNKLPLLCNNKYDSELNLLLELSKTIKNHYNDKNKSLVLILDGIQTANFSVSSYCIIKNLIIVEGFFVIPITQISGFLLNPIC